MQRRTIGGLEVGAVGLGCMGMTWAYTTGVRDESESARVIHRAIDLGVTLLDTADIYGPFTNEELVGRALRGHRDDVVLATKVGLVMPDPTDRSSIRRDGRPEHVRASIVDSLRRLGTDHVDLYQLHRVDEKVPLADTWGAMAALVSEGLVRAIGLSEVGVAELELAHAIHPVATVQNELSLWTRDPLESVVPWALRHDAGVIPFSPLGRGFLTGRYRTSATFGSDDFRSQLPRFTDEAIKANLAIVDRVSAVAARHNATPGQVALAWVLAQGDHVVPIPGTKRLSYLEENVGAAAVELTESDLLELDSAPPPVGGRY